MLRKHLLVASLTAVFICVPTLASANANPFLPAPVTPQVAPTTGSVGSASSPNQEGLPSLPMPPASGLAPVLPGAPVPLIPTPAAEELPIGKVNGELIYKDGTRYKFKDEKKESEKKPKSSAKKKKPVKPVKAVKKQNTAKPQPPAITNNVSPGQPKVIKVLPNAIPVKAVSPGARTATIPPKPGKPAVVANKPSPASNSQGAKSGAVPIKVITENK